MELISQLMFGLIQLHKENIVHRDVKPQNILILESSDIESRYSITLIDFGIARKVKLSENEEITRAAMAGTEGFIAPECFSDNEDEDGQLSTKNDLWSCGSTIARLLFEDYENLDCDPNLLHGMIDGLFEKYWNELNFDSCPGGWRLVSQIIKGMLINDPNERYSCQDVLDLIFRYRETIVFSNMLNNIQNINLVFLTDREIAWEAVTWSSAMYQLIGERWKYDMEFISHAIKTNAGVFEMIPKDLKRNKEFLEKIVELHGGCLEFIPKSFKNKEIVLKAVKSFGFSLKHAGQSSINDEEIVMAAVQQSGSALSHASENMRRNREIVLAAVQQNGLSLKHADPSLLMDEEIVKSAVRENKRAIRYVTDDELKKKIECEIEETVDEISQEEIENQLYQKILEMRRKPLFIEQREEDHVFMNEIIKFDKNILLDKLIQTPQALSNQEECIRNDTELLLQIIEMNPIAILEFVLKAARMNGMVFEHLDESFRKDREIALAAVSTFAYALNYVDPCLRSDRELVIAAVSTDGNVFESIKDESLKRDKEILEIARKNGYHYGYIKITNNYQ